MSSPRLSFLIVNYNGGPLLSDALAAIERQTFTDYEVLVVDNGSGDRSWELPCFERDRWFLERLSQNTGFAEANNSAFRRSRGSIIALINNDVMLDPRWAERVVEAFADPEVSSVACRLFQMRNPGSLDSAGFGAYTCCSTTVWRDLPANHFASKVHRPLGPIASASAYRRTALEKVGLFHQEYFAYYEDTDLAMRLVLFGFNCRYVNDAVGYHLGSATGKQYSDFHRFHLRRNIEFVYWVNMVGGLAWRHLPSHVAYEMLAFVGMFVRGQGKVFWKAKREAIKMLPWIRHQRKVLRDRLQAESGIAAAKRRLAGPLKSFWLTLVRVGNRDRL